MHLQGIQLKKNELKVQLGAKKLMGPIWHYLLLKIL